MLKLKSCIQDYIKQIWLSKECIRRKIIPTYSKVNIKIVWQKKLKYNVN